VRVGHDELRPAQPTGAERTQQRRPEVLVLAVAEVEAEHDAAPVGGETERDADRLRHDPVVG